MTTKQQKSFKNWHIRITAIYKDSNVLSKEDEEDSKKQVDAVLTALSERKHCDKILCGMERGKQSQKLHWHISYESKRQISDATMRKIVRNNKGVPLYCQFSIQKVKKSIEQNRRYCIKTFVYYKKNFTDAEAKEIQSSWIPEVDFKKTSKKFVSILHAEAKKKSIDLTDMYECIRFVTMYYRKQSKMCRDYDILGYARSLHLQTDEGFKEAVDRIYRLHLK